MAKGLEVWIYRPDIEAQARKINPHFVFNADNERYFDVLDRTKALQEKYGKMKEERDKKVCCSKIEVPYE